MPLFQSQQQPPVNIKKLTTYLGTLLPPDVYNQPYNGKSLVASISDSKYKQAVGQYEAVLTQASYMARLSYEINACIPGALQLINFNPVVFNTGLGMIRREQSRFSNTAPSFNSILLSPTGTVMPTGGRSFIGEGASVYGKTGMTETPVFLQCVDYRQQVSGCPFPGKKVLYISFRGTMSIKSGLTDVKVTSKSIDSLFSTCTLEGMNGSDAIAEFKTEAETYRKMDAINPFGAHHGFVENLIPVMNTVCTHIQKYTTDGSVDKIIVTGHSLGGANASLAAFIIAAFKYKGVTCLQKPSLHCITFGAPKLLTDFSREIFNRFLDAGILTLDRVANRAKNILVAVGSMGLAMDVVPTIPANFVHPGYMILKNEMKTQSKTGRSKNITDIRQMFGGIQPASGLFFTDFNGIPTYKEFLDCFTRLTSMDDSTYKSNIMNLPFGTLFFGTKGLSYAEIKNTVKSILGRDITDMNQKDVEMDSATSSDELSVSANLSEETAENNTSQTGGFLSGPLTEKYKLATVERGPNHVVYNCQKNLTIFSCHMAYLGVSYHGGFKNVSHTRKPLEYFVPSGMRISVVTPAATSGGKRKFQTRKRSQSRKNMRRYKTRK